MSAVLETMIRAQQALIAALDGDDVDGIARHSASLATAIGDVRALGKAAAADRTLVDEALRLADAARVRINVLADMTERRLVRLAAATGVGSATPTYGRNARLRR